METNKFRIWYQQLDDKGNVIGTGMYHKEYCYFGTACRKAHELYGDKTDIRYSVCPLNPYEERTKKATCDTCGDTYMMRIDEWGHAIKDHVSMYSPQTIPPEDGRRRFARYLDVCPNCIRKIKNFVDSLKENKE